ncbi:MAG TPA: hypothetical protein VIH89_03725 [Candidatus Sulfotelmatobacter sp.]|jgi:hypothetical protein
MKKNVSGSSTERSGTQYFHSDFRMGGHKFGTKYGQEFGPFAGLGF